MPRIAETNIKKWNKIRGLTLPISKLKIKSQLNKTVQYWHKDRHIDTWKKIQSSEIKPYIYGQFIFHKGTKTVQWGKRIVFLTNSAGTDTWIPI